MQLFAYNQVGEPDELIIWVGVLGVVAPPPVTFTVGNQTVQPFRHSRFEPLGDAVCNAHGRPLNHRAIFHLRWPDTEARFTIYVALGEQRVALTSRRLPTHLPAKGSDSFNLLLSSCYYQPNDKSVGLAQLLDNIKPEPDFTVLAGDQVYLDLPSLQNLPKDKTCLAQALGKKYQLNWFSDPVGQPGLAQVLRRGPVLCIPDDHEYWNNFPLYQLQLDNTHSEQDRHNWRCLAAQFYARYQMSPAQSAGFFRQDIAPLSMLFLDGRSSRDDQGKRMFNDATHMAIERWMEDLLALKRNNQPAVGLLSSGQALLIEKPGLWARHCSDMEMPNYEDFCLLTRALENLCGAGIPVLYITGDVHWGRVVEGCNQRGQAVFYEVIASPSRLLATLGCDQFNLLRDTFRGVPAAFPLHPSAPEDLAGIKLANLDLRIKHRQQGDHVAMLRFHAVPGGIEFSVDYLCTDPDATKRSRFSSTQGPFKLLSM